MPNLELVNFLIGVSISVTASFLASLGVNLQAGALKKERERNAATETPLLEESDINVSLESIADVTSSPEPTRTGVWAAFRILMRNPAGNVRREAWSIVWIKSQWYIGRQHAN
jgi:hypothetical protein